MKSNSMLRVVVSGLLAIGFLITSQPVHAQTGREIMQKALHKTSWQTMQGDVTLILTNARGEQRIRKIKMFSRKRTEDENDMLMRFVAPPDVRGTAFLIIEHAKGEDERYLYLPALRRVKPHCFLRERWKFYVFRFYVL